MTRAELLTALQQQRTENSALRAELVVAQTMCVATTPVVPFVNQEQLVLLMQELYAAVLLTDADSCVTWVSQGFSAFCGLELHEVLGHRLETLLRPVLQNTPVHDFVRDCLQAQTPFHYEARNPRLGLDAGWIRVKVQPLHNEQGEVVGLAGMLEDITEWKQSIVVLAESEQRFRTLAENVPVVLYEWRQQFDGQFEIKYISNKALDIFGVPLDECGDVLRFLHPDDVPALWVSIEQCTRTQSSWFYEGRVLVPGQPLRWMRGSSTVTSHDAMGLNYSGLLQDITQIKEAESAVRERDLRLHLAVEGFGDGIWELNLHTRSVFFSVNYKAMLGYSDAEFSNEYDTWLAHVHPDDVAGRQQIMASYLQGDVPIAVNEYRLLCKDGTYKWVLSRAVITEYAAAGGPVVLTGTHTDISALKTTQAALDATNRRLSTVLTNFQDGLVLEDENRRIVLTNQAFCDLLRVPVTLPQLVGQYGDWLTEGTKKYFANPVQYVARVTALLHRKKPVVGDILALRDGRVFQRDFTPIFDGRYYIGHLWKYADITVRSKAEEDLKRREEKYRGIIENMSLGLVEANLADHLLYANQSFCDMTGFRIDELAGRELSPLLLSGPALVESKKGARESGVADSYEVAIKTKSGELKWLLVSGAPLYDDAQVLIGSIGIYLDVTPQKHLEASLREAKGQAEISTRAKQAFLANMSHEIRTPMNAILGMSELLAKTALHGPQASYLHAITASAENLLVIINDILDLSKIEAGRMTLERIGFDSGRICCQVEETLRYKAEEKGLDFVVHIDPAVPAVLLSDPYRITQILLNLVGNAVKFTEKGAVGLSCVLIERLSAEKAVVEFVVQDTGVGIDAGYLEQVFDDFSQEDSSVTRTFGGTGLGLGISKKLVELLGGELRIESQKNQGTISRFTLLLHVGTAQDLPRKGGFDVSHMQAALRGKRILLVEDNQFNRMLAMVFLANCGMEVTEAENGQVAVVHAQNQSFDLILMDLQMPVMDGYKATEYLRQQLHLTVPIIALTANAISGERSKCLAAGMNDYLTKPFQEVGLVSMVHDWIIGRAQRPVGR